MFAIKKVTQPRAPQMSISKGQRKIRRGSDSQNCEKKVKFPFTQKHVPLNAFLPRVPYVARHGHDKEKSNIKSSSSSSSTFLCH